MTPWPHLTPGQDPVPIVQEAGWASGLVWTDAENLAPTGIRSPDHPARRQSLYRLRYPAYAQKQENLQKIRKSILVSYFLTGFFQKIFSPIYMSVSYA